MMRAPGFAEATPSRFLVAALSFVLLAMTSSTSAWSIRSSLSNASALYFEESLAFRVYLMPEEILDYVLLPGFGCSIVDEQAYIKTIVKPNGTLGTLLQWNNKAPPEKKDFTLKMNCAKVPVFRDSGSDQSPTDAPSRSRGQRVARDVTGTDAIQFPLGSMSKSEDAVESTTAAEHGTSPSAIPQQNTSDPEHSVAPENEVVLESANPAMNSTVVSPTTTSISGLESTTSAKPPLIETTSQASSIPTTASATTTSTTITTPTTTAITTNDSPRAPSKEITLSTTPSANSESITDSIGNESAVGRQPSNGGEPIPETSTSDSNKTEQGFSLVITRVSMDCIHGQKLSSFDDVRNITGELEAAISNRTEFSTTVLKDSSSDEKQPPCLVLPKEVRVLEAQYVLFALGLNATSGEPIRAGHMLQSCGYENWRPGNDFLAEAAHVRFLDVKLFQLQVLSICLAAAVIVFALSAVFLCTKWRLAVRGSRGEAHDEFYIKTFHTKEHQYAANGDDFYGFPTIRRDSTFHRSPNTASATPNSIGGSSFVNDAFQDGEDHQNLPAPPPELRTCIINDANFTEVPLHNLGSDSLRAHRGAHRHQSPPPPPLRTVSSGYMSGQSTPAGEYHNPQDVMILPPIPKEDYSDSDSESGQASLETEGKAGRAVERKGRFTAFVRSVHT